MAVVVTYTPGTNTLKQVGGTEGTPALIIDLLQFDFDTPYTLLNAAVIDNDPDVMSLDNPVRARDSRGLRLLISSDVDRAGATVDIVGRDADGDSVTESGIDIATALTTAVETESKYSQIFTVTFNNMVNGDEVTITQPRLGVIAAGLEPDSVQNGGFDVDALWIKEAGWTISGGSALYDGSGAPQRLSQGQGIISGESYLVKLSIKSSAVGEIDFRLGGAVTTRKFSEIGTYQEILVPSATFALYIWSYDNWVGSIDNVTVQKLTGQYGIGCNIEFGDGSTPSWFESYGESVRFDAGMTYETKANAVLKQDWNRRMFTASKIGMLPVGSKGLA